VCSTANVDLVRSLGADHVIDYTKDDFTQGDERYDLIFDNVGNHTFAECRRVLTPDGIHMPNTGHAGMGYLLMSFARSSFVRQQASPLVSTPKAADLDTLAQLVADGTIAPVMDRTYPLAEVPEALEYIGTGHARGKVTITI